MLRTIATSSALVLALGGTVLAQSTPATAPDVAQSAPGTAPAPGSATTRTFNGRGAAFGERGATFALRAAYRTIADAEARGASAYLEAAKTHYRNALARFGRNDRGAASEALAAAALARAAVADHPLPVPRDIPPPPALSMNLDGPGPAMQRPPGAQPPPGAQLPPGAQMPGGSMRGGPMRGGGRYGGRGMRERFDATQLAADVKLANTAEARDLAQKALDADIARTRAAFSGNADEALREGRLASDLAQAVRSLAFADHPPAFGRRPPPTPS